MNIIRKTSFRISRISRNMWQTWKKLRHCFFKSSVGTLVSIPARGCCQCQKFTWIQTRPIHRSKLHQKLLNTLVTISGSEIITLCILKRKFVREKVYELLFSYSSISHCCWQDTGLYSAVKSRNSYVSGLKLHFLQVSLFSLCLMHFLLLFSHFVFVLCFFLCFFLSLVFPPIRRCSLPP